MFFFYYFEKVIFFLMYMFLGFRELLVSFGVDIYSRLLCVIGGFNLYYFSNVNFLEEIWVCLYKGFIIFMFFFCWKLCFGYYC